jgi:hypothetical protein
MGSKGPAEGVHGAHSPACGAVGDPPNRTTGEKAYCYVYSVLACQQISSPSRDPVPLEHLHINPIWLNAERFVCLGVGVPVPVSGAQGVPPEEPAHHGQRGNLSHLRVVVHHLHQRLINYKDTKTQMSSLRVFNRVYRLEILSVMLVFSTQLCELAPI